MFDPSSFANPTPLAHANTSRDVLQRGGTSQSKPSILQAMTKRVLFSASIRSQCVVRASKVLWNRSQSSYGRRVELFWCTRIDGSRSLKSNPEQRGIKLLGKGTEEESNNPCLEVERYEGCKEEMMGKKCTINGNVLKSFPSISPPSPPLKDYLSNRDPRVLGYR
ncbi:hypothetical protein TNCV_3547591 [Trichonephila clavipes]|nr:hypothetical protein TNCV_3547591 [Trichonephila clavipes]